MRIPRVDFTDLNEPFDETEDEWGRKPSARPAKVPAWFDLRRYDGLRGQSALQWYKHIALRRELFALAYSDSDDLRSQVDRVCEDPLNDCLYNDKRFRGSPDDPFKYILGQNGVNLLSLRDLKGIHRLCEGGHSLATLGDIIDLDSPIRIDNYLGEAVQLMYIDLSSSDYTLVEQFKKTLVGLRKLIRRRILVETIAPAFETWIDHGILPFFDLKLWGIAHNKWIPNPALARAIYADKMRGEGSIRNTTETHARALMQTISPASQGLEIEARSEESFINLAQVNINDDKEEDEYTREIRLSLGDV